MKLTKLIPFLVASVLFISIPITAVAESLDSLKDKEAKATAEETTLNKNINEALNDVNEKYTEIEKMKVEISNTEKTIKNSESEILETEKSIERRKEVVGNRMKDVQLNGEQRTLQVLLDAENFSDFFNKAYAMTMLQNLEREKIDGLSQDKEKLASLQETVKNKQSELQLNEAKLQEEAEAMDEQVSSLKTQLAGNQEVLQQIASEKQTEEKRLADEKKVADAKKKREEQEAIAQAEAAKKQAEASQVSATKESSHSSQTSTTETNGSSTPVTPAQPETPTSNGGNTGSSSGNGQVLYMESTAYSWREAGSGYITATGIDVRTNSNVVAVDPSVIPLGSLVKVDGYGYAVAGDTGGAIKGNIIDVHFDTVAQCTAWGRRHNVRVELQ